MQEKSDEVIHSYTRQEAIEDGLLVDVSNTPEAKEAGFKASLCLTRGVYRLVEVPAGLEGVQDLKGRLWDTLFLAAMAFRVSEDKYFVPFQVSYLVATERREVKKMWLMFNEAEGVTILLPEEY
jgi:Family of unknown function (DUF6573)